MFKKIWLKYLLGCAIGFAAAFVLQGYNNRAVEIIEYISELTVNVGKYSLIPLLFFTMTVSVFELREEKRFWRVALKTLIISVITTVGLMVLGLV
ncbi:MAG: cation:dicarboxylase symporter family transporter, partial [Spirochaetaceae bacterium]|nr:cation:dicarboxylase symporter family transporter [Spirochaetaceae bacterium]